MNEDWSTRDDHYVVAFTHAYDDVAHSDDDDDNVKVSKLWNNRQTKYLKSWVWISIFQMISFTKCYAFHDELGSQHYFIKDF